MLEAHADFTPDVCDNTYLNIKLVIKIYGDRPDFSKTTKIFRNKNSLPIGKAHNNPILDKIMSKVDYKDGHKTSLAFNAITENIFAQVDGEVNWHVLFQYIVNHRYDGTDSNRKTH